MLDKSMETLKVTVLLNHLQRRQMIPQWVIKRYQHQKIVSGSHLMGLARVIPNLKYKKDNIDFEK